MILADSSIWIDHIRQNDARFSAMLARDEVLCHPFVLGEIACGSFAHRAGLLRDLRDLPLAPIASNDEVMQLIDAHRLMGRGTGFIDMHLLASTTLAPGSLLLTHDRRLAKAAESLGVAAPPL